MNTKSILGMILSIAGIVGLLYTVLLFSNNAATETNIRIPITYGVLGIVLLISGIGLNETVKHKH